MSSSPRRPRGASSIPSSVSRRGGGGVRAAMPHQLYMRLTCLEMERHRRGIEREAAMTRVRACDDRSREIEAEMASGDRDALEDEIGDLLFATASLARKLSIDPERALKRALEKFRSRFELLESEVRRSNRAFGEYTLDELEAIWQRVK